MVVLLQGLKGPKKEGKYLEIGVIFKVGEKHDTFAVKISLQLFQYCHFPIEFSFCFGIVWLEGPHQLGKRIHGNWIDCSGLRQFQSPPMDLKAGLYKNIWPQNLSKLFFNVFLVQFIGDFMDRRPISSLSLKMGFFQKVF